MGERPDTITYSSLITACGKGGKTEKALDLFNEMQQAGERPNTITYSSLITACANGGKTEKALASKQCLRRSSIPKRRMMLWLFSFTSSGDAQGTRQMYVPSLLACIALQ